MADGMSAKFMKSAFVGWTMTCGQYYPPDFDATKLVPLKRIKPKQSTQMMNIRMMFPFTMVCDNCKEYNYTGTKFTSKVERIKSESYLGLMVYRFYGNCKNCWSEFTFKTDPKNSDYTMESGGKRTYEAWKDADLAECQMKAEKQDEAKDAMKLLEQKSIDVQAEMQRIEDLDAIRALNKRNGLRDQTIEEALDYIFHQRVTDASSEGPLAVDDVKDLQGFRDAQDEARRQKLQEDVDSDVNKGGSSSSSAPKGATDHVIAAVVAERAASRPSAVGARFSVKRKADKLHNTETLNRDAGPEAGTSAMLGVRVVEKASTEESGKEVTCAESGISSGPWRGFVHLATGLSTK